MARKNAKWLRERLSHGETILGTHSMAALPMLTEAMAAAGFDCIWIDMEHTPAWKGDVINNLIAARAGNVASLVRIPWNDPVLAKPILDMGPDAIVFPYIRNFREAQEAVRNCLYPPKGVRGFGPMRAIEYGKYSSVDYVDRGNLEMLRLLQIEHIGMMDDLERIAAMEEVDGFVFGPNDLAGSMGEIGRPFTQRTEKIFDEAAKILEKAKKPFGVSMDYSDEQVSRWAGRGAQLLFVGNDIGYVYSGARKTLLSAEAIVHGKRQ